MRPIAQLTSIRQLLSTAVTLTEGTCVNAHLSALLGSRQTYGPAISEITMMQVTLTPVNGAPQHMFGHYETPYGTYGPAVAMEAEHDVDMLSATSSNASGLGSAKYLQEPTE